MMDDLKTILGRIMKANPRYEEHALRTRVFEAWPTLVGEKVAQHCWPTRLFDDGILIIGAESNAWLHSLRYLEAQILDKYEKELGSRKVKGLRYKLETTRF